MPVDIGVAPKADGTPLVMYDDRQYTVLEGAAVGFNGLANLKFLGKVLKVEYSDINGQLLLTEEWRTEGGALIGTRTERGLNDPRLIGDRDLNDAVGSARLRAAG